MARDYLATVNGVLAGRYIAEAEIGHGAAARVYRARDQHGEIVALKVLHPELLVSSAAERFLREVGITAQLDHPHIVPVLDSGTAGWLVYYAMPLIAGPSLREALDARGALPAVEVVGIAHDLLSAMSHAHDRGLVHRDIKPENVMLDATRGAMLLDFGIARAVEASSAERLTAAGMTVGSAGYMSPEQVWAAADLDQRSDLYSLGCVLFECAAGRLPFTETQVPILMHHQVHTPAPPLRSVRPDAPAGLAAAIDRALAKKPDERWASAAAMRAALPQLPVPGATR